MLGKAALPDDLPFVTGSIGLLGTRPSYEMMTGCDTLFMIGSRFPYTEFLPEEGQARGVQIDLDPRMVSMRYPMEVNLIGDSAETLRKLLPLLERNPDRSWRETIEKNVKSWWEVLQNRAMDDANPLNPRASSGNCRRGCRRTASSLAIPARAPTGMRATSRSGAG